MKIMRMAVMAGCLGFLLVAVGGVDDAGAEPFRYTISGTSLSTTIDTDDDGNAALAGSGEGKSTLGPISIRSVLESVLTLPPAFCFLPDGSVGIEAEAIFNSTVFQVRGGDLLYAELVEGTACLSLDTCFDDMFEFQAGCILSNTGHFQITGGTGKFTGASGSYDLEAIAEFLVVSPTGSFSSFVSEAEGEIHVPRGH